LDLSAEHEIVQKSGTWFTYGQERLGQGRENAKNYLREHPETMAKIEHEVRKKLLAKPGAAEKAQEKKGAEALPPAAKALPAQAAAAAKAGSASAPAGKRTGASATAD
ncbi:MAG: hypothetical protein RIR26_784, partial [Pseudomonadota bacterium]